MTRKIGLQLYSLRELAQEQGMAKTLELVKKIGYNVVEPAGFADLTPQEFAQACKDNGLTICSSHKPSILSADFNEVIDTHRILGLNTICFGHGRERFATLDDIKQTAEKANELVAKVKAEGMTPFMHNHWWEYQMLNGKFKIDYFLELCPDMKFELDSFWTASFGQNNPVAVAKQYSDRVILLHMKDGIFPANSDDRTVEMCPLGEGQLQIPEIIAQMPDSMQTIIVELDKSNQEMVSSITKSYNYLKSNGLGE